MGAECIKWDIDPVLWSGPFQLRWYSLFFLCSFLAGAASLAWQLRRGGYRAMLAVDFITWSMVGAVVGGWLGHNLFYRPARVLADPALLLDVAGGVQGLSAHGTAMGLLLALYLFARRHGIPGWDLTDRFCFGATGGFFFVRLGNLFNSEILGRPTALPWAVCFLRRDAPPLPRHPSQVYEVLMALVILGLLLLADRLAGRERRPVKLITGLWFLSWGVLRFGLEFFKAHLALPDSSPLTMGQWLCLPTALFGAALLVSALARPIPATRAAAAAAPRCRAPDTGGSQQAQARPEEQG